MTTLLLNAPRDHIAEWLIRHTANALARTEYAEADGRGGALQPGRRIGSRIVLEAWQVGPLDTATDSQTARAAGDGIVFDLEPLASERTRVTAECHAARWLDYFAEVLGALAADYPETAAEIFGRADPQSDTAKPGKDNAQAGAPKPWEAVADIANDRRILERWHAGDSAADIASAVNLGADYIRKRISELRQSYGDEIVPRRRT